MRITRPPVAKPQRLRPGETYYGTPEEYRAKQAAAAAASDITTNEHGGRHSRLATRCDLLPPLAMLSLSRLLAEGVATYGERANWQALSSSEHIQHALEHMLRLMDGQDDEDHLQHAALRLAMALDVRERGGVVPLLAAGEGNEQEATEEIHHRVTEVTE